MKEELWWTYYKFRVLNLNSFAIFSFIFISLIGNHCTKPNHLKGKHYSQSGFSGNLLRPTSSLADVTSYEEEWYLCNLCCGICISRSQTYPQIGVVSSAFHNHKYIPKLVLWHLHFTITNISPKWCCGICISWSQTYSQNGVVASAFYDHKHIPKMVLWHLHFMITNIFPKWCCGICISWSQTYSQNGVVVSAFHDHKHIPKLVLWHLHFMITNIFPKWCCGICISWHFHSYHLI